MCPTPPDRNTVPLITLDASVLRLEGTGDDEAEHVTGAGELRPEALVTADEIADGIAERLAAEIEARVRFRVAIAQRVDALEKREAALDEGIDGFYTIALRVHELSAELDQLEAVATALAKEGQKINAKNSMIKRFFARVKKAVSPKKGLDLLTVSGCLGDIERRVESLSLDLVSTGSLFSSRI